MIIGFCIGILIGCIFGYLLGSTVEHSTYEKAYKEGFEDGATHFKDASGYGETSPTLEAYTSPFQFWQRGNEMVVEILKSGQAREVPGKKRAD